MAKFRGIIFDLDGTLLNSIADIADAANEALARMNFPTHPVDQYKYFVGDGVKALIERILPKEVVHDENLVAEFIKAYSDEYAQNWDHKTHPYEGIPELLDEIDRCGLKKAVFSNKPAPCTERCVAKLLGKWKFDEVVGQKDGVIPKKPDPTGGLYIMNRWGFQPNEILYIGDTSTDMQTALNAGFYPIGVTWGFRPEEELRANHAKKIVYSPMEIAEVFH